MVSSATPGTRIFRYFTSHKCPQRSARKLLAEVPLEHGFCILQTSKSPTFFDSSFAAALLADAFLTNARRTLHGPGMPDRPRHARPHAHGPRKRGQAIFRYVGARRCRFSETEFDIKSGRQFHRNRSRRKRKPN